MNALEILNQWVSPITRPLEDFLNETQGLAFTHQNSVKVFNGLVQDLTDPSSPDAFVGDAANSFVGTTSDYLTSETALSGAAGVLDGPLADAGVACATAVGGIGDDVEIAADSGPEVDTLADVTAVIDVTTIAQGGLDVPEDVVAAGATSITVWTVIGILVTLAVGMLAVWLAWQNTMNMIARSSMPKLPQTPKVTPQPPVNTSGLTTQQKKDLEELTKEFPAVNPEDIKGLLLAGFTPDEIREILKAGFTHAQIQAVINRIRQAQSDQNGTDKLGLTADQIRNLTVSVAEACLSSDPDVRLEGQVARTLISDLVSFKRKVYDASGTEIGEIDIETSNAIIEVTSGKQGKLQQLTKELSNPLMNPEHKKIILYAPNYSPAAGQEFTVGSERIPIIRSMKALFDYLRSLH